MPKVLLVEDSEDTAQRLLAFKRALSAAAEPEPPQTLTLAELGRRFRVGPADAPAVLARAQELGVLRRQGYPISFSDGWARETLSIWCWQGNRRFSHCPIAAMAESLAVYFFPRRVPLFSCQRTDTG